MTSNHVIIGAGATGAATARRLSSMGESVSLVTRSGSGPDEPGITRIAVDATDTARLIDITTGASVLYNSANPPYNRWTTDWPPLAASLLRTAEATGAVLVTLNNLYAYPKPTAPMRASDPLDPPASRGQFAPRCGTTHWPRMTPAGSE